MIKVIILLPSSDRPDPPGNLNLVSTATGLTLVWDRPSNAPSQVSTNYTLSIFNVTESGNMPFLNNNMITTSFSIHFLEESLLGMPCQRFQFWVTAENDAGVGSPAIYNETVPVCKFTKCHSYCCAPSLHNGKFRVRVRVRCLHAVVVLGQLSLLCLYCGPCKKVTLSVCNACSQILHSVCFNLPPLL